MGSGRDHLPRHQQRRLDLVAVCRRWQPADGDARRVQDGLLRRGWRAVPRLRHFRQLADRPEPLPEYVARGASLGLGCLGPPCSTSCSVRSLCARLQASPARRSRWPIAATRRGRPAPSAPASLARACPATPAPRPVPALAPRRSPEPGAPSPLAAAVRCPPSVVRINAGSLMHGWGGRANKQRLSARLRITPATLPSRRRSPTPWPAPMQWAPALRACSACRSSSASSTAPGTPRPS